MPVIGRRMVELDNGFLRTVLSTGPDEYPATFETTLLSSDKSTLLSIVHPERKETLAMIATGQMSMFDFLLDSFTLHGGYSYVDDLVRNKKVVESMTSTFRWSIRAHNW